MRLSVISKCLVVLGAALLAACSSASSSHLTSSPTPDAKARYHLANKLTLGGEAGWDYLALDPEARRLYVTHLTKVEVLDADTLKSVGQIKDTPGVHGVALVPRLNKAFTSNGKANTVSVIDMKTLEHVAEIKAGEKPDAIIYDPDAERVFVSNGESDDVTAIDATTGKVVGTIAMGGAPEYSAADGKGTLWVNLEDKNAFVTIDAKTLKLIKTTPLPGCEEPASMAFDKANRRLFIGCKNHVLAVVDPDSGKVIKKL